MKLLLISPGCHHSLWAKSLPHLHNLKSHLVKESAENWELFSHSQIISTPEFSRHSQIISTPELYRHSQIISTRELSSRSQIISTPPCYCQPQAVRCCHPGSSVGVN